MVFSSGKSVVCASSIIALNLPFIICLHILAGNAKIALARPCFLIRRTLPQITRQCFAVGGRINTIDTFQKGITFAADDWRSGAINDQTIDQSAKLRRYLEELARQKQATPAQISLAWILNKKPYMVPIPGMKKSERLAENAGAANIVFTSQEMEHIEELVAEYHAQEKNPNA